MNINIQEIYNLFAIKSRYQVVYNDLVNYLTSKRIPFESGTKRIVIEKDQNTVYKIAFQPSGVEDNIMELVASDTVKKALQSNQKLVELFNHSIVLSCPSELEDPSIIVCEKMIPIQHTPQVQNLCSKGMSIYDATANLYDTDHKFKKQIDNIQNVLSSLFEHSDTDFDCAPLNYGVRVINGGVYACIGDLGSVVPRVNGQKPECPICGRRDMVKLKPVDNVTRNEIKTRNMGFYTCPHVSCENYILNSTNFSMAIAKHVNDVNVVNRYINEHKDTIEVLKAASVPFEWRPKTPVRTYQEFVNSFYNDAPLLRGRLGDVLPRMFESYSRKMNSSMNEHVMITINKYVPNSINHLQYKQYVQGLLGSMGLQQNQMQSYYNQFKSVIDIAYARYTYNTLPQLHNLIRSMGPVTMPVFINTLMANGFNADGDTYGVLYNNR